MTRCFRFASVSVLFVLVSLFPRVAGADEKPKPVKLEKSWNGVVAIGLKNQAPRSRCITDKESWENLWNAYRGTETVPVVDFDKELVLVAVNSDPNGIGIGATLDDKGDVKITLISTLVLYTNPTTCAYQFAVVKRAGIKTIGGNPIGGK